MGVLTTTMFISWVGSKTRARSRILPYIARAVRKQYIEPFGGGCGLLMGKPPEESEIYNDVNLLLVNLFRTLRRSDAPELFTRLARVSPKSLEIYKEFKQIALAYYEGNEERFRRLKAQANLLEYDDQIVAAFCFFYCQRHGFAGNFLGVYGREKCRYESHKRPHNATYRRVVDEIETYCARVRNVEFENLSFEQVFEKYDDPTALFYCDPPYDVPCSVKYATNWNPEKTKELVEICAGAKGGVILSCYDSPIYETLLKAGYERARWKSYMTVCKTRYEERTETLYYRFKEKERVASDLITGDYRKRAGV